MGSEEKPSSSWVPFQSWLAQQRNGDGSPEADNSNDSLAPATNTPTSNHSSEDAHPQAPQASRPQDRQSSVSASLARDCRMETRLLDGSARGRQDMTIMLAAPGMPLHKSPLVTTRQATSLLTALCEPLVQVSVGRLTRRLESPTMLHATQDMGVLSLWLLPNDDLSLVWQGRIKETPSSRGASEERLAETISAATPTGTAATSVDGEQCDSCDVTLWEELARFPSGAHPGSNDPVITIHMLRGDSTGRSFYIRPRIDAIAAQAEAAANKIQQSTSTTPGGPVSAVDSFLESAFSNNSTAAAAAAAASGESSIDGAAGEEGRRMYFWLTGPELASAARSLGRLKSLVKRPPTLVKRSGVDQRQLNQIAAWLQQLDIVAHQQQAATAAAISAAAPPRAAAAVVEPSSAGNSSSNSSVEALLGHQGEPRAESSTSTVTQPVQQQESGRLIANGAVSATAAAVYRDRRFNISCPCAITVGAAVSLSMNPVATTEVAAQSLLGKAALQAKQVAEDVARRTVDRIGRRNLEEAICESLIRSVRAQRAKAKAQAQAQRERQSLQQQAEEAQPLIKKAVEHAVARGGTAPQSCKLQVALQIAAAAAAAAVPDSSTEPLQVPEHSGSGASDCSDGASTHSFANSPRRSTSETAGSTGDAAEAEDNESCATSSAPPNPPGSHHPHPHPHHAGGAQGRVTIDDLHTLLNTSGATGTAAAAGRTTSGKVNISDLTELLESSRQPTSGER